MKFGRFYTLFIILFFAAFAVVFNTFPRSVYSPLEKRELAQFPTFTWARLQSGAFTRDVSAWFSDSEPFRDHFMTLSMEVKHRLALSTGEENITFHAATPDPETAGGNGSSANDLEAGASNPDIEPYRNNLTADDNAKISNAGIIVTGSGKNVRALMAFGGSSKGCVGYARAANLYHSTFPGVNIYCMLIPTAVEYYCPDKARRISRPQYPNIRATYALLDPGVKAVDVYTPLGRHAAEAIYLRTDHHWAPLGGFYAAEAFAKVAGVPFKPLSAYDRKVVHGYVGSMYGYAKDIALKNAPEDFVYHVPRDVTYTATYTDYTIDKNYRVVGEGRPRRGIYFQHYRDGSPGAYCTFMGGDTRLAVIRTSTPGHRRLIILKDSFGNTLPGYLFYSFSEIHVIDSRYFTKNMKSYVAEHKITDILFANNIFKAYSSHIYGAYLRFLSQSNHTPAASTAAPAARPAKAHSAESKSTGEAKKNLSAPHKAGHEEKKKASAGTETPKSAANTGGGTHHSTTSGEHSSATSTHAAPAEKKSEE